MQNFSMLISYMFPARLKEKIENVKKQEEEAKSQKIKVCHLNTQLELATFNKEKLELVASKPSIKQTNTAGKLIDESNQQYQILMGCGEATFFRKKIKSKKRESQSDLFIRKL